MSNKEPRYHLTGTQQFFMVLLRLGIGWHFLREGWVKLVQPNWTAEWYLTATWGPFAPYFQQIANTDWLLQVSDIAMPWLLFLSGLGLMLGLFTRLSTVVAMVLLATFYLATPPWNMQMLETMTNWTQYETWLHHAEWAGNLMIGSEGNYAIVNKNLIEFLALAALLAVNSGRMCGFDPLISQWLSRKKESSEEKMEESKADTEVQPQTVTS